ncbi:MAG TPA: triose-phosphate isomerase [Candidatus Nitrosopelagicus sp.]|jgi:triosephosphate isomerase|nr:triose-phosphate isomerase [Candidatus Nitrosopelagicus sp.]|tara:strand:- start:85 stop:741 length:657 start_codon:yes stop_codon:yes gene_type:complete
MFIINCKNYEEIAGEKIIKLAKIAAKISKKYKIKIAIAPPHHLIPLITKFGIIVLAQHLDDKKIGSTTGFMIPEIIKKSKIDGSIINHSEHRITESEIKNLVKRLKKLKLKTVVCVKNVSEAKKYAKINPTFIAIEPPELIGTGRAISTEKPQLITNSINAVQSAKNSTKLLCGAGIVSAEDVSRAVELGSKGILVASGVIKAKNWESILSDFSRGLV